MRTLLLFSFAFLTAAVGLCQSAKDLNLETGKEIFEATCVGCHGADGKGQPATTLGFEPPATFPDFTDCSGSTRESYLQWNSVIHDGGRARAFAEIMPSFGPPDKPALTDDEIHRVIGYIRTFCAEDSKWPSGDFNFARPLVTEKSFPEDEIVLTTAINTEGTPAVSHNLVIEKRFGAIFNMEARFRGAFEQTGTGTWIGALGDISFEFKRTMYLNNKRGSILAWGNEITLPTGDPKRGLGNGITKLESFVSYGQIFPKLSYLQTQVGIEGPPFHRHQSATELYNRTAIGKAFGQNRGFGRLWSLWGEAVSVRQMGPSLGPRYGPTAHWTVDVIPGMQVTLSRRQHMRLGVGLDIPTVNASGRSKQLIFYLLWDTFDGGLREGWR